MYLFWFRDNRFLFHWQDFYIFWYGAKGCQGLVRFESLVIQNDLKKKKTHNISSVRNLTWHSIYIKCKTCMLHSCHRKIPHFLLQSWAAQEQNKAMQQETCPWHATEHAARAQDLSTCNSFGVVTAGGHLHPLRFTLLLKLLPRPCSQLYSCPASAYSL